MPTPPAGDVAFSPRGLLAQYVQQDYEAVTRTFLAVLQHFAKPRSAEPDDGQRHAIDAFVETFLFLMTKADYQIPESLAPAMIEAGPTVANLVAVSKFRTTDPQLQMLLRQQNNLVKLLVLCSARNEVALPAATLFEAHPGYASLWYVRYFSSVCAPATRRSWENLRRHLAAFDERFVLFGHATVKGFFQATYLDPDRQAAPKAHMGRLIRKALSGVRIRNRPRRGRIAVITSRWIDTTSVYRSAEPFVSALTGDYDLTLVHLGAKPKPPRRLVTKGFSDVRHVQVHPDRIDLGAVADNDFQLAYFPDVGMTLESLYLSNLRLAPIQVMGHGHPVSTYGSEIDYFISGVESEPGNPQAHYAERLVLLGGLGVLPVWPREQIEPIDRPAEPVVVNCPWTSMKVNYPLLDALREVARRADRHVVFRFFPGPGTARHGAAPVFRQDVESVLGASHVEVVSNCPRGEYLRRLQEGHLSAEAYPFGGYNSTVDSLYLHLPVVSWEGERFYSRAASCLLRRVGLDEFVAGGAEEYAEKILALVDDPCRRQAVADHLAGADLKGLLCTSDEAESFREAIDMLIERHEEFQADGSREPIRVG